MSRKEIYCESGQCPLVQACWSTLPYQARPMASNGQNHEYSGQPIVMMDDRKVDMEMFTDEPERYEPVARNPLVRGLQFFCLQTLSFPLFLDRKPSVEAKKILRRIVKIKRGIARNIPLGISEAAQLARSPAHLDWLKEKSNKKGFIFVGTIIAGRERIPKNNFFPAIIKTRDVWKAHLLQASFMVTSDFGVPVVPNRLQSFVKV